MPSEEKKDFDELVLKKVLYKISPHLHPRIIESISYNSREGVLAISINEKANQKFINEIILDFNNFNPTTSEKNIINISIPENNIEKFINKIERQDEYDLYLLSIPKDISLFDIYFDDQLNAEISERINLWNKDKKPVLIKYGDEIVKYYSENDEWKTIRLGNISEQIFKNLPFSEDVGIPKLMKPSETKELRERITLKDDYISIARDIKNTTDIFDFEIIEKKPGGAKAGVKLGNAYIKKMNYTKSDLLEYVTYVAFHEFLGTKSPQVDLLKDSKNNLWMASMSLSQDYVKNDTVKSKKFTILDKIPTFKVGDTRETPLIGADTIDLKSIAKLMLLSVLFRAKDLHMENVGIVSDSTKQKLSIVDLQVTDHKLPNFSTAKNFENLLDMLGKEFEIINQGLATYYPAVPKLIDKLKSDISGFLQAIDAISHPLTENKQKTKTVFYTKNLWTFFESKGETFRDVLEKSFNKALNNLVQAGFDPSSTVFASSDSKESIKEILDNQKQLIIASFQNLESAISLINKNNIPKLNH